VEELPDALAIVTHERWDAAQQRLKVNKELAARSNKNPQATLFRGVVFCGVCQSKMYAMRRWRDGERTTDYACSRYLHRSVLPVGQRQLAEENRSMCIASRLIDVPAWEHIRNLLTHPEIVRHEFEARRFRDKRVKDDLAAVEEVLGRLDKQKNRLLKGVREADDEQEADLYRAELKMLSKQIAQAAEEQQRLSQPVRC
jgi:Recombinase zinc beta ribbon domain